MTFLMVIGAPALVIAALALGLGATLWLWWRRERAGARRVLEEATLLRALFEHAAAGLIIFRVDGRAVRANPAAARIMGSSIEELERIHFFDNPVWAKSGLPECARQALQSGYAVAFGTRFVSRSGRDLAVAGSCMAFREAGEQRFLFSFSDEHEKQQITQDALAQLKRVDRMGQSRVH